MEYEKVVGKFLDKLDFVLAKDHSKTIAIFAKQKPVTQKCIWVSQNGASRNG